MHKNLRVQLPDLRYLNMRVDFSVKTFSSVIGVCKDLGIRHPEELSFCKPLETNHLKYNYKEIAKRKNEQNGPQRNGAPPADTNTFIPNSSPVGSTGSLDKTPFMCAPVTPNKPPPSSTPVGTPVGNVSCNICTFLDDLTFPIAFLFGLNITLHYFVYRVLAFLDHPV